MSSPSLPGGPNCTATGSETSCNVTGLTNGTSYTFSVTATNSAGTGPASGVSSSVVPALCPMSVGDIGPGGGLVFLKHQGTCYEMAPKTWGAGETSGLSWCDANTTVSNAMGTAIGTGPANTAALSAASECSSDAAAAVLAYATNNTVAGQWFLPSKDELNAMCNYSRNLTAPSSEICSGAQNEAFAAGTYGLETQRYWSSSQGSNCYSWSQSMEAGGQSCYSWMSDLMRIRPIRSFTSVPGGSGGGTGGNPAPVVATPTPTPTPTPSASATPTVVPTPTPTASASASASPTVKAPAGFVQLSAEEKASAQTPVVNAPLSTSVSSAPVVSVPPGTPVAPVVSGLPSNKSLKAGVKAPTRAKEAFVTFGTTRSNANGRAKVPAFKPSRSGIYTIQLATADGTAFYLKVQVAAKKASSNSKKPASSSGKAPVKPSGKKG